MSQSFNQDDIPAPIKAHRPSQTKTNAIDATDSDEPINDDDNFNDQDENAQGSSPVPTKPQSIPHISSAKESKPVPSPSSPTSTQMDQDGSSDLPQTPTPSKGVTSDRDTPKDQTKLQGKTVTVTRRPLWKYLAAWAPIVLVIAWFLASPRSPPSLENIPKIKESNWRDYVDQKRILSHTLRSNILASLKPISASAPKETTVATLLILSEDEEKAAELARCLLPLVNTRSHRDGLLPEIDFSNDQWTKLKIDQHLQALLKPDESILGVILRQIDHLSSEHALDRARLLFSYCDGENPKIPHRLIIMTATDKSTSLRDRFRAAWVKEADFIDPLMARISGNTIIIDANQSSIC